jgi:hypothetical protein
MQGRQNTLVAFQPHRFCMDVPTMANCDKYYSHTVRSTRMRLCYKPPEGNFCAQTDYIVCPLQSPSPPPSPPFPPPPPSPPPMAPLTLQSTTCNTLYSWDNCKRYAEYKSKPSLYTWSTLLPKYCSESATHVYYNYNSAATLTPSQANVTAICAA